MLAATGVTVAGPVGTLRSAHERGARVADLIARLTCCVTARTLDEDGFLEQAYLIHAERERQLFDALEKMSGKKYTSLLPVQEQSAIGNQQLAIENK